MYFADRGLKGLQPGRDVLLVLTDSWSDSFAETNHDLRRGQSV